MKCGMCVAVAVIFSGCGALIPSERKTNESVKAAGELSATHSTEVRKAGQLAPVTINARGLSRVDAKFEAAKGPNVTEIKESDTQVASGQDALLGSSVTSIPLFVKVIGLVAGLAGLVWLIQYLRKSSPAIDAAIARADQVIASQIAKHREVAITTADPTVKTAALHEIGKLEAERGKMAANQP